MAWELREIFAGYSGDQSVTFKQWTNRPACESWLSYLATLLEGADALMGTVALQGEWEAQRDSTREIVRAIGMVSRSLNLPVPVLEPWAKRLWVLDPRNGGLPSTDVRDRAAVREFVDTRTALGEWASQMMAAMTRGVPGSVELRSWMAEGKPFWFSTVRRVDLALDGTLIDSWLNGAMPDLPNGSFDNGWNDCGTGVITGWQCWTGNQWFPGWGSSATEAEIQGIVPLRLHAQMAIDCARRLVELGPDGIVIASKIWAIQKNAAWALALGQRTNEGILNEITRDLSLRNQVPVEFAAFEGVAGVVASLVALANPLVGALMAVVWGIPRLLMEAFGTAVAYQTDPWDRREPVYDYSFIEGTYDPPVAPSFTVPMAPTTADVGTLIPFLGLAPGVVHFAPAPPPAPPASSTSGGAKAAVGLGFLWWLFGR